VDTEVKNEIRNSKHKIRNKHEFSNFKFSNMEKVLNFEIRILGLFRLPAGRQGFRIYGE